jgi:ABC-type uncharacterized transport system substrate-binding protein
MGKQYVFMLGDTAGIRKSFVRETMRSQRRGALVIAALLLFLLPDVSPSHPHVFIRNSLKILFDQRGLSGVRVRWVFDEFFSCMIVDEFDHNHNNKLEKSDIHNLKEGAFANLAKFDYFSFITINGKPFKVGYIRDFSAALVDGKLIYRFTIPCHVRATTAFKEFVIAQYDPTYYTRVALTKERPVIVEGASRFEVSCRISKNMEEAYYYGQVHPVEVKVKFKRKND